MEKKGYSRWEIEKGRTSEEKSNKAKNEFFSRITGSIISRITSGGGLGKNINPIGYLNATCKSPFVQLSEELGFNPRESLTKIEDNNEVERRWKMASDFIINGILATLERAASPGEYSIAENFEKIKKVKKEGAVEYVKDILTEYFKYVPVSKTSIAQKSGIPKSAPRPHSPSSSRLKPVIVIDEKYEAKKEKVLKAIKYLEETGRNPSDTVLAIIVDESVATIRIIRKEFDNVSTKPL